jgi:electron transfer flavoprotein beta subunit
VEQLGGADLVLMGAVTLDTGQSQLGPRLAEALGWPQIVNAWAVRATGGRVEVVCQDRTGYVIHDAALPAVVTVMPGSLKPRYPDGVRLVNVYKGVGEIAAALEQWEAADLVDAEFLKPLLEPRGRDFPPLRERGVRASGTVDEMAQAAADVLHQRVWR